MLGTPLITPQMTRSHQDARDSLLRYGVDLVKLVIMGVSRVVPSTESVLILSNTTLVCFTRALEVQAPRAPVWIQHVSLTAKFQ